MTINISKRTTRIINKFVHRNNQPNLCIRTLPKRNFLPQVKTTSNIPGYTTNRNAFNVFSFPITGKISKSYRNYIYEFVFVKRQKSHCQLIFEKFNATDFSNLRKTKSYRAKGMK